MKQMMQFLGRVGQDFTTEIDQIAERDLKLNVRDLCEKYSMEAIASCVFGVRAGCFTSQCSQFVMYATNIFR